jgi:hypothetical protein
MTKLTKSNNEHIINKIYQIRDQKVMLDSDLANLYEVETKVLNQAVKRNIDRFPEDFMFQLTKKEYENLRSQIVTFEDLDGKGRFRKYLPYVFTEQGVAMLSGILKSERAIKVNIAIMRAFVRIKNIINSKQELQNSIDFLRYELLVMKAQNKQRDEKIEYLLTALDQMIEH